MHKLIKTLKTLSDETRLRILNILLKRECCVCEVLQALDISESRASRNLRILYDAGFLRLRKDGLWSFYSIDKEDMPEYTREFVEAARLVLTDEIMLQKDIENLKNVKESCQSNNC